MHGEITLVFTKFMFPIQPVLHGSNCAMQGEVTIDVFQMKKLDLREIDLRMKEIWQNELLGQDTSHRSRKFSVG